MPPVIPDYDKTLAIAADDIVDKFINWKDESPIPISEEVKSKLTTGQLIYILGKLSAFEAQPINKLEAFNKLFNLDKVKNSEIKFRWLRICLKAHWEEKVDAVLSWINVVGRMKFVRPLYRDLYNWEASRNKAIENFKQNKHNMMHVSAYTLEKDLHLSN